MTYPRLLITDIDGTLTEAGDFVSPPNRAAVAALIRRGVYVTLATGRTRAATELLARQLGIRIPLILCNGALVFDLSSGHALFERRMSRHEVRRALTALAAVAPADVELCAYVGDSLYASRLSTALRSYLYVPDACREVGDLAGFLLQPGQHLPTKILALADAEACSSLTGRLQDWGRTHGLELNVVQSDAHCIEILPNGVCKGRALRFLARRLGLGADEVVAIGNAPNDLGMIRWAGLGVAVATAHPDLLAAADRVTVAHTADALARIAVDVFQLSPAEVSAVA